MKASWPCWKPCQPEASAAASRCATPASPTAAAPNVQRCRSWIIESVERPSSGKSEKTRAIVARDTKWRGPSTSRSTDAAPASCSATVSSAAELPLPTTSTRLPPYERQSRTCQLCRRSPV